MNKKMKMKLKRMSLKKINFPPDLRTNLGNDFCLISFPHFVDD